MFAGGFEVAGVGVDRGRVGVGFTSGVVGAAVFALAAGGFAVGVGFGVLTGTGQRINPLGWTEQPGGISCMNGL